MTESSSQQFRGTHQNPKHNHMGSAWMTLNPTEGTGDSYISTP